MTSVISRSRGEEPTQSASPTTATSSGPSFETRRTGAPQDEAFETRRTGAPQDEAFQTRLAGAPQHAVLRTPHRAAQEDFRWAGVEMRPYKEDERALYKAITRQILFSDPEMAGELRYFEIAPGGF